MIIQCEKCRTRFKLDDSRVTESGVRVRCSRCGHTFIVKRETPEEETDFDALLQGFGGPEELGTRPEGNALAEGGTTEETPAASEPHVPLSENAPETSLAEEKPSSMEEEPSTQVPDQSRSGSSDFLPEGFGLTHFQVTKVPAESEEAVDSEVTAAGDGAFLHAEDAPVEEPAGKDDMVAESPSEQQMEAPELDVTIESEETPVTAKDERKWPVADSRDDETAGTELPPLSISSRRKKSPLFSVLVGVLCLVAVVGAGFFLFRDSVGDLAGRIPKVGTEGGARATIQSLEGSFLVNKEAGELFVIRGEVFNSSGKPLTALRVQGTVYGVDGSVIARRTVYCGNTFTPEELAFRSYSGIEKTMDRQFGDTLANLEIPAGKGIPFAIVFRNVPKEGKDFGAEIVDPSGAR